MRFLTLLALLLPCSIAVANDNDFSGAWVAWLCPNDVQRESGLCSNFVLELIQKEGKLCGAHMFATAGATRVDEGAAPSVIGDISDGTAKIVAISGRAALPVRVRVEIKKLNGALQWQRLENPKGDYLLPLNARLTRSRSRTLFAPLFEQELKAACSSVFAMEAEKAAVPR
jgi:hypothetical protein